MDDGEDEERAREPEAAALKVRRILAWRAQLAPAPPSPFSPPLTALPPPIVVAPPQAALSSCKRSSCSEAEGSRTSPSASSSQSPSPSISSYSPLRMQDDNDDTPPRQPVLLLTPPSPRPRPPRSPSRGGTRRCAPPARASSPPSPLLLHPPLPGPTHHRAHSWSARSTSETERMRRRQGWPTARRWHMRSRLLRLRALEAGPQHAPWRLRQPIPIPIPLCTGADAPPHLLLLERGETVCPACDRQFASARAFRVHAGAEEPSALRARTEDVRTPAVSLALRLGLLDAHAHRLQVRSVLVLRRARSHVRRGHTPPTTGPRQPCSPRAHLPRLLNLLLPPTSATLRDARRPPTASTHRVGLPLTPAMRKRERTGVVSSEAPTPCLCCANVPTCHRLAAHSSSESHSVGTSIGGRTAWGQALSVAASRGPRRQHHWGPSRACCRHHSRAPRCEDRAIVSACVVGCGVTHPSSAAHVIDSIATYLSSRILLLPRISRSRSRANNSDFLHNVSYLHIFERISYISLRT
ncbi:hypothetical protein FB451DRAFT_1560626 [Mycena latifolia]|nr:hypothetical protein FB451DRAFT_1560626 [Mycena latifolia]